MISIVEFVQSVYDESKQNMSGFSDVDALNGYINRAQLRMKGYFDSIAQINQKATNYLRPVTKSEIGTSDANGILELPEDYDYMLSVRWNKTNITNFPAKELSAVQADVIYQIPHRAPSTAGNRVFYQFINDGILLYPEEAIEVLMRYTAEPPEAFIVYTYSIDPDTGEDLAIPDLDECIDLVWNKNVYNLLLYMTLEEMGMAVRENILLQYAQMGIQEEKVEPKN